MRTVTHTLLCLLLAISCQAEVIIVDDDGPADFNNIQAAIDDSNDGDTIYVFPGTYTGTGNRDIDFLGKAITVQSLFPDDPYIVAATIIDCDANASDPHRAFVFQSGEDSNSVLAGFTIMNGYESVGGGIYCNGSSPTITNCVITANTSSASGGGGIGCYEGYPTISNCLISYNQALSFGKGGGISCDLTEDVTGAVNIDNCTFIGNSTARDGGAIEGWACTGAITNCTFMWNVAGDDGGALSYCPGRITNCIFIANSAGGHGGALYNCMAEMSNCILSCNSAAENGGGAYAVFLYDIWPNIINCTITGNSAGGCGGGVFGHVDYINVTNCILWGNTDHHGTGESSQICTDGQWEPWPYIEASYVPDVTFSCIQDDDPNDANIPFGGEENGNIDGNPMFVRDPDEGGDGWGDDPGTPDVNEGENDDLGDLHLQNSSPCIDAGYSSIWPFPEGIVDIDGEPRIMAAVVDIGADEFFMPTVVVTKPEGGDVWASGSLHEITWYSHIYEGPVDILFSESAGSDWETVESNLPETGSHMWYLPDMVDSNQCVISAVPNLPDPNVVSVDSGLFTIHPDFVHPEVPARWESRGGDFTRSGLSENYGPELGCLKWQFQTDGPVWASATIGAGDRVHVACGDGKVYTLDLDDGSLVWSYDTNSELLSSPTIGPDGSVFVGSEDGKLYAISIGGTLRWTHTTDGWIYSSPAVSDEGDVYVCSQDGILYALGYDGSELWTFEPNKVGGVVDAAIFASPAIGADGTVYIAGLYDANLYALDPNDGSVKWDCNFGSIGGAFASPVVAPDGTIYQTLLFDANLYAIDSNTGTILWSADMADPCSDWFDSDYVDTRDYVDGWYEPAVGPDGTIYVTFNDPYLRAVDTDGNIMWVTRLGMTGSFSLAVGNDGLIYAAGEDGYLCAVDANGEELARFEGNDLLGFPVIAADNTIVVSDANNRIWAIGGEACEYEVSVLHRPEDLDGSRATNLLDFATLAMDWLACSNTDVSSACDYEGDAIYLTGDINRNLYVEFEDVAVLVNRWLSED